MLSQWAFEVNKVWNTENALTAEYSWLATPGIGYMNFGTSEFDLQKELKIARDERDLTLGAAPVQ